MVKKGGIILVSLVVVFLLASDLKLISSIEFDCLDACQTGCVNKDARLAARCDAKCRIRCGPDSQAFSYPDRN